MTNKTHLGQSRGYSDSDARGADEFARWAAHDEDGAVELVEPAEYFYEAEANALDFS